MRRSQISTMRKPFRSRAAITLWTSCSRSVWVILNVSRTISGVAFSSIFFTSKCVSVHARAYAGLSVDELP